MRVVCVHDGGNTYLLILLFAVKNGPSPSISREEQTCVQTHVGIPFLNVSGTENNVFLLKLNFQLWCCEEQLCGERERKSLELLWIIMQRREEADECSLYKGAWAQGKRLPLCGCRGCLDCSISWAAS